jgi:hypothetical protein
MYEDARNAPSLGGALREFLQSMYEATRFWATGIEQRLKVCKL